MTWYGRIAAVILAGLAVSGLIVWANVTDRYLAASDIHLRIGQNVGYSDVQIPLITSSNQVVTVGISFYVGNPSGIAIEVTQISYRFYMDNLSDQRPFAEKADSIFVATGGFFPFYDPVVVSARSSDAIWANMTIDGSLQHIAMDRLNTTFNGKYHPIIDAGLVYRIHGTAITDRVLGIVFATVTGVAPSGS